MKYLITRTDDFGSAASADRVIFKAVSEGNYVKNVSCMAVAPHIEKDAKELEELRKKKDFCIGLHATLNSEWEKVNFISVLNPKEIPSLVNEAGIFPMHPMFFAEKMPRTEECIREISAQLDKLTILGLTVEYVDTHMLPDAVVPGLKEALTEFARKKGLVDQRWFYTFAKEHQPFLTGDTSLEEDALSYDKWMQTFEEGKQYINILHPALYSEETKLFYNHVLTGDSVAYSREAEQILLNSGKLEKLCESMQIQPIKYTDAIPQGDTTMSAAENF